MVELTTGATTTSSARIDASPGRRSVFFLHVPRTGGVSLRNHLANHFTASEYLIAASALGNIDKDPGQYRFVEGVVHISYARRFSPPPFVLMCLRDPIDRAVSVYHSLRSEGDEALRRYGQQFGPDGLARRRHVRERLRALDIYDLIRREPDLAYVHLGDRQARALSGADLTPSAEDFEEALANLERCDLLLLTERLDEANEWLGERLGCGPLGPMRRENAAPGRPPVHALDRRTRDALAGITTIDKELHRCAIDLFERRLSEWRSAGSPPEPTLDWDPPPDARDFSFDQAVRGSGWEPREFLDDRWFCWTGATHRASLDLSITTAGDHDLYCEVAHVLKPSILDGVEVCVNGQRVPVTPQRSDDVVGLYGTIPGRTVERGRGTVRLDFLVPETMRPRDVNPKSPDRRELGIALSRIRVEPRPSVKAPLAATEGAIVVARRRHLTHAFMPLLGTLQHHEPKPLRVPARYARTRARADTPSISVVTPSLNQVDFIAEAIRSVVEQGYPRLEYVVQDGGSTDGTRDVLEHWNHALHHWESAPDGGQAAAINAGFRHVSGEILSYLNADDVLLPGSLATVGRYFQKHPTVDVVYGHRVLIDADSREIGRWVLPRHSDATLLWVDFIPQETLFWRRELWKRVGGLDERVDFVIDWDLALRFREAGATFARLPRFFGAFRIHAGQKLATMSHVGAQEASEIRQRVHGRVVTQAEILVNVWPYLAKHVVLNRLYRMRLLRY